MAPSTEGRVFRDARTGAVVRQWTGAPAIHHHLYFTNPSVSEDGRRGYFISYRSGHPNLHAIELEDGSITPLTDRNDLNPFSPAPSRTEPWIYFSARSSVWGVHVRTAEARRLVEFPPCRLGICSLSPDGRRLAIALRFPDHAKLALVDVASGAAEILASADEVGHVQFCPADPDLLLYSGTIRQRLWICDLRERRPRLLVPQPHGEWFVHESWLGREILYIHWPRALRAVRADGTGDRVLSAVNGWHAAADRSARRIVCDTNHPDRGLLLVDPGSGDWSVLCEPGASQRGTQWPLDVPAEGPGIDTSILRSDAPERDPAPRPDAPATVYGPQWTHPHPSFAPDGRSVVFTSDRDGWSQVYQVSLPD